MLNKFNGLVEKATSKNGYSALQQSSRFVLLLARNFQAAVEQIYIPPSEINIGEIIENLLALRSDYLSDCAVVCEIEHNLPSVQADRLSILQVLINLVNNAAEAMHGEGQLTIHANSIGNSVRLSIEDNGPGIQPSDLPNIFNLSYSTKGGHERGIGLHIVASIIKQLNGSINVESTLGIGTKFTLLLPTTVKL